MIPYKFKYDLNHPNRSIEHKEILVSKKSLRKIYESWYNVFKSYVKDDSIYLELGSGGGFIKDIIPQVITSDINKIPGVDQYFSASELPYEDQSVSGIFMIDALHHFPEAEKFFSESVRVLKTGGKIVLIEPWNTKWARFIYKRFHHELFDLNRDWTFPLSGPLSGSNMALPYIIFKRDIEKFKDKYPKLNVKKIQPHTPFTYLLTGGFSRRAFLPGFMISFVRYIEKHTAFIRNKFAMFVTIEIEKVEDKIL